MPCHPRARTLQSEVGRAMPDNDLMASANCRKKIWAATGRPTTTCSVFDIPLEGWFLRFRTTGAEAGRYRSLRRTPLEIHWAFPTWCHDWRSIGGHRPPYPLLRDTASRLVRRRPRDCRMVCGLWGLTLHELTLRGRYQQYSVINHQAYKSSCRRGCGGIRLLSRSGFPRIFSSRQRVSPHSFPSLSPFHPLRSRGSGFVL